jgi:dihydrolipoamide dehydrogenase
MSHAKRIIIVGGGVGGYTAAIRAAQLGAHVVLIEKDSLGGTCLNRGCIPTKALMQSAAVHSLAKKAAAFGVRIDQVSLDFHLAMSWKDATVERMVGGVGSLMRKNKIEVIKGTGTLVDSRTVRIVETEQCIEGDNVIIATGSKPSRPRIEGADEPGVMTSDDALAMGQLPQSLLIIGGGVVGLELAQIFHEMGAKVTVLEMMPHILPTEDAEIAGALQRILEEQGIEVFTGVTVDGIAGTEQMKVSFAGANGREERTAEKVLLTVGRTPNTDDLGIEKLELEVENSRIVVNEHMETSIPGLYAIGDVVGRMMLAHVASDEAKCAVENLMGSECGVNYQAIPRCVYTLPEVAAVGLTEAEAREEHSDVKIGKFPFSANGRALTLHETGGLVKFVVGAEFGEILGVHILGPEASELIAEAVFAMQAEATYQDIASCVHAHPTLSEAIMEAALAVEGRSTNV